MKDHTEDSAKEEVDMPKGITPNARYGYGPSGFWSQETERIVNTADAVRQAIADGMRNFESQFPEMAKRLIIPIELISCIENRLRDVFEREIEAATRHERKTIEEETARALMERMNAVSETH